MKNIKATVTETFAKVKDNWKEPSQGKYMPFKEIASLAIGGMGVKFICYAVQLMVLSVGNTLIGNTIGIPPQPMYIIYIISVICGFPLTALRAKIIDNSRNPKGKFRPYIFTMAIPTVLLAIGFTWMPYDSMTMVEKCITVLLYNIGFQFFYMFMFDSYTNIINVLSPNTYERSDVCSITSVTDSFAPTIVGFLMPILAYVVTGERTIYDMKIYRVVFPPILLLGLLMTVLIHTNTKEKIMQPKNHIVQIRFIDALRAVAKNKYFWIISLASWLGFLESSFATILAWLYNYQEACTPVQYSIVTAVYGNSALWSMLFAPMLIRKVGKRNLLLYSNLMSIGFILLMYPVITQAPKSMIIWLMLGCMFINGLVTSLGNLLQFSVNGDIRDYQQYVTGERIDGIFLTVGIISSVVNMVTGYVLPLLYESAGLNETVAATLGYSNVYDVLFNEFYFQKICGVLVVASAVGATLNAIPYFFYDLTEVKQKAMMSVLKIRAMFEDYANGQLNDEQLVETIELIDESRIYVNKTPVKLSRKNIRKAKTTKDKEKINAAKQEYAEQKLTNEKITIAQYVIEEIDKFDTDVVKARVIRAEEIVSQGIESLYTLSTITLKDAKAMPKTTAEEKELRKIAISDARKEKVSKKMLKRHFPNGIERFDVGIFDSLFAEQDALDMKQKDYTERFNDAKAAKDDFHLEEYRQILRTIPKEKSRIKSQLKSAIQKQSIYNRAAAPYIDAEKLLVQRDNYSNYSEIKAECVELKTDMQTVVAEQE